MTQNAVLNNDVSFAVGYAVFSRIT